MLSGCEQGRPIYRHKASEGRPLDTWSSQGAWVHPLLFNHCLPIHLWSYEDTVFSKAQFTPFSPLLKIKNSTLFNDLNNLEPMNKSFAQEATVGCLFLLIVSH